MLAISIAVIDQRKMIIPDGLNALLGVCGFISMAMSCSLETADLVLGPLLGGAVTWCFRVAFYRIRQIEGLGLGDVKFVAAAGCWTGALALAPMMFISTTSALAYVLFCKLAGSPLSSNQRLPFGPFLSLGLVIVAWVQLVTGQSIYFLIDRLFL